eukprot:g4692.t1
MKRNSSLSGREAGKRGGAGKVKKPASNAAEYYGKICARGKVRVDPELSAALMKHKIYQALDGIGESELSVLCNLLSKVRSVQMVKLTVGDAGADSGRTKRKLAKLGITSPYICEPAPGLKLAKSVAKSLSMCTKLMFVSLKGIKLHLDAIRSIGRSVAESQSIRRLDLENCKIGDDGLAALCRFLRSAANLNDLSVAGNRLSERSAPQIASLLKHHSSLRDDMFWSRCLRDGSTSALKKRKGMPSSTEIDVQLSGLVALDISRNKLCDVGATCIAKALTGDEWLVALNLRANGITESGAKALFDAVKKSNESLSVIDFRPMAGHGDGDDNRSNDDGEVVGNNSDSDADSTAGAEHSAWAVRRVPRKGMDSTHAAIAAVLRRWGISEGSRSQSLAKLPNRKSQKNDAPHGAVVDLSKRRGAKPLAPPAPSLGTTAVIVPAASPTKAARGGHVKRKEEGKAKQRVVHLGANKSQILSRIYRSTAAREGPSSVKVSMVVAAMRRDAEARSAFGLEDVQSANVSLGEDHVISEEQLLDFFGSQPATLEENRSSQEVTRHAAEEGARTLGGDNAEKNAIAAAPQVPMTDGVDEKIVEAVAASLQRLNSALDDMVPKVSNGSVMAERSGLLENSEPEDGSGRFAKAEDGEQYSRRKLRAAIESRLRDMFDL